MNNKRNTTNFTTNNPQSAANPRNVVLAQIHNAGHATEYGQLPSEIYDLELHEITAHERESKRNMWKAFVARVIGGAELIVLLTVITGAMVALVS